MTTALQEFEVQSDLAETTGLVALCLKSWKLVLRRLCKAPLFCTFRGRSPRRRLQGRSGPLELVFHTAPPQQAVAIFFKLKKLSIAGMKACRADLVTLCTGMQSRGSACNHWSSTPRPYNEIAEVGDAKWADARGHTECDTVRTFQTSAPIPGVRLSQTGRNLEVGGFPSC